MLEREVMSIESDFFKRKRFVMELLVPYGFVQKGTTFHYHETFMDGDFEAEVQVTEAGQVSGRVIDTAFGEEYLPLRLERTAGNYVGQVHEAYEALLGRIADACCEETPFIFDQTNRLATYLAETFGDHFDHPFEKYPSYASFRVSGKWYALLFPLKMGKLAGVSGEMAERDVEVVNIKVDPSQMSDLLEQKGIYPSYHMSKKAWVSVVLDDSLPDDQLFELVRDSRQLVNPNALTNPQGPDYWIIPANMKDYDIDKDFAASPEVVWTQKASIRTGDIVLIYITAPTKAVRYICRVLEDHIVKGGQSFMRLRLLKQFDEGILTFDKLKTLGVTSVRGPRRVTAEVIAFVNPLL